jgi:hypothetical protein
MVKHFRPTRLSKKVKLVDSESVPLLSKAGQMLPKLQNHKYKTQTQELAEISLNLVDKIEHLAPIMKKKEALDDSFTFEEIIKITTFEKNTHWTRGIQSKGFPFNFF